MEAMKDLEQQLNWAEEHLETKVTAVENKETLAFKAELHELERQGQEKGMEAFTANMLAAQERQAFIEQKKDDILTKYQDNEKVQAYLATEAGKEDLLGPFNKAKEEEQHKMEYYQDSNPELVALNKKIDALIFEDDTAYGVPLAGQLNALKRAGSLNETAFAFRKGDIMELIKQSEALLMQDYEAHKASEIGKKIADFEAMVAKKRDDLNKIPATRPEDYMNLEAEIASLREAFETPEVIAHKEKEGRYRLMLSGIEKAHRDIETANDTHVPRADLESVADTYHQHFETTPEDKQ